MTNVKCTKAAIAHPIVAILTIADGPPKMLQMIIMPIENVGATEAMIGFFKSFMTSENVNAILHSINKNRTNPIEKNNTPKNPILSAKYKLPRDTNPSIKPLIGMGITFSIVFIFAAPLMLSC